MSFISDIVLRASIVNVQSNDVIFVFFPYESVHNYFLLMAEQQKNIQNKN